ncbi:MerR family transcriptional regulator [Virgibacillus sp. 6R]|uniref:MerR family transcriptional regulator n=1 Tax=Metabacillus sp. 22489 TaxID=3453928 RepID=UPI00119D63D7
MRKQKLSTGEIARICNINKKTLFYYDKIDLLKPAIVDSNGYRYYTTDQIDILSKIKALQSVGFTLLEIKKQLSVEDISKGIATLHEQKQKITEKVNELVNVESALSQKIQELEHYKRIGNNRVFIKDDNEEYMYLDETPSQEEIITNYLLDGYHSGIILNVQDNLNEKMKITKYQKVENWKVANYKKEKGKYVGVYFVTEENNIIENAKKALLLIKNSGYCPNGPAFLKDIATDFVNYRNGRIPFLITRKLEDF